MGNINKVQKLPGFRDYFVSDLRIREYVINTFKQVFEKYGYEPLETPALEPSSIFVGELGDEAEKLFYRFKDNGNRDVMLKYDVMTSMCRCVAENINTIAFPYKRYQIQNVYRAEKPQKGRFREFTQCDADTIGSDDVTWDAEFIQMGIEALKKLGFSKFRANINNRKLLNGIVQYAGATDKDFVAICISIDKLPKIGREKVRKELIEKRKIKADVADKILDLVSLVGDNDSTLNQYQSILKDIPVAIEALTELKKIFRYFDVVGLDKEYYRLAPFIARGLAYYTGPVWEFEIIEGGVGSVAGCGRYDNIIGRFVGQKVPATGGSFGIDRIVEILKEKKLVKISESSCRVMVTVFNTEMFETSLKIADSLRKEEIATMLYPVVNDKLQKQLKYADKKKIPYVIIIGPDEEKKGQLILKEMLTRNQYTLSLKEAVRKLK